MAMVKDIAYYKEAFTSLNTNRVRGLDAPHKPLLLLSVIDMIDKGVIDTCRIYLSDELIQTFDGNARRYFGKSIWFKPDIFKPYHHMAYEPFWRLIPNSVPAAPSASTGTQSSPAAAEPAPVALSGTNHKRPSYTLGGMRKAYRYALIDPELFELLQDETVRAHLRSLLIATYLAPHARNLPILEALTLVGTMATVIA